MRLSEYKLAPIPFELWSKCMSFKTSPHLDIVWNGRTVGITKWIGSTWKVYHTPIANAAGYGDCEYIDHRPADDRRKAYNNWMRDAAELAERRWNETYSKL